MIDCIVRLFQRYIFTDTDRKAQSLSAFPVLLKCKILYLCLALAGLIAHYKMALCEPRCKCTKFFKILEMS